MRCATAAIQSTKHQLVAKIVVTEEYDTIFDFLYHYRGDIPRDILHYIV